MRSATCETCGASVPYMKRRNAQSFYVYARCSRCDAPADPERTQYSKDIFFADEIAAMCWDPEQKPEHACGFCGQLVFALHGHHLFPREWYGADCDNGPIINLCGPCHDGWHARAKWFASRALIRDLKRDGHHELAASAERLYEALPDRYRPPPIDTAPRLTPRMPQMVQQRFDRMVAAVESAADDEEPKR